MSLRVLISIWGAGPAECRLTTSARERNPGLSDAGNESRFFAELVDPLSENLQLAEFRYRDLALADSVKAM